jgi:hypothetical protein
MEILEWTFKSGWRFLGVLILISAMGVASESFAKTISILIITFSNWFKNK